MTEAELIELHLKELEEAKRILAAKEFGQAVQDRRKELRWSQQDLADALSTSQSVISSIEKGSYLLTLDLITRLSRALKISPVQLATAYWQNEKRELSGEQNILLEQFREMITEYYQIGGAGAGSQQPGVSTELEPKNAQAQAAEDLAVSRQKQQAEERKKTKLEQRERETQEQEQPKIRNIHPGASKSPGKTPKDPAGN